MKKADPQRLYILCFYLGNILEIINSRRQKIRSFQRFRTGQEREVAVVINGKMRNPSGDGNILYLECINVRLWL